MRTLLLAAALWLAADRCEAVDLKRVDREAEAISWALSAASHCPAIPKDSIWLDGTCVQLVTKTAGSLLRFFVPESAAVVKALLEIIRCERGPKTAGGTAPFLGPCVERKAAAASRDINKWKTLRAHAPDLPDDVPDAPLPQGDVLFH